MFLSLTVSSAAVSVHVGFSFFFIYCMNVGSERVKRKFSIQSDSESQMVM